MAQDLIVLLKAGRVLQQENAALAGVQIGHQPGASGEGVYGPITDEGWEDYKEFLVKKCGMDDLLQVYQAAYDRYTQTEN